MKKIFYLYILTNKNNKVFYIGSTSNILKRIFEHKQLIGSKFTSKYKTTKLVYYETCEDMNEILHRERLMKHWKRPWKIELINQFNPSWEDLFKKII